MKFSTKNHLISAKTEQHTYLKNKDIADSIMTPIATPKEYPSLSKKPSKKDLSDRSLNFALACLAAFCADNSSAAARHPTRTAVNVNLTSFAEKQCPHVQ